MSAGHVISKRAVHARVLLPQDLGKTAKMAEEGELCAMLARAEAAADADEASLDDLQQTPVEAAALSYAASQPLTQTV